MIGMNEKRETAKSYIKLIENITGLFFLFKNFSCCWNVVVLQH